MSQGKQRIAHTPHLDGWRAHLRAAVEERGAKADLARFMVTQGRRGLQANKNLIGWVLQGSVVPNAEDLLAMDAWIASRTATTTPT